MATYEVSVTRYNSAVGKSMLGSAAIALKLRVRVRVRGGAVAGVS